MRMIYVYICILVFASYICEPVYNCILLILINRIQLILYIVYFIHYMHCIGQANTAITYYNNKLYACHEGSYMYEIQYKPDNRFTSVGMLYNIYTAYA